MKRIVALVLAVIMVFALVACGEETNEQSVDNITTTNAATTVTTTVTTTIGHSEEDETSTTKADETSDASNLETTTKSSTGSIGDITTTTKSSATTKSSTTSNKNYHPPVFTTEKEIDNLPVYLVRVEYAYKIVENEIELEWVRGFEYNPQNYYKPYKDMYALELGTLVHYVDVYGLGREYEKRIGQYYKVSYKGEVLYIKAQEMMVSGDSILAQDGNTYKLGEVIYHGENHDIVVTTRGKFICSDGCEGVRYDAGPDLKTLADFCRYADASYTDTKTGISYPLCTSKPIYTGQYGSVYALSNGNFESLRVKNGFMVIRHSNYQSVSFEDIDEETQKFFLDAGMVEKDAWYYWDFNAFIYTLEDAKLQADSFESIKGRAFYRATWLEGT